MECRALLTNDALYRMGLAQLYRRSRNDANGVLKIVENLARWAHAHHPGRFADGALENAAFAVGRDLDASLSTMALAESESKRTGGRTLHVATKLFDVGGHTRVLARWIERDRSAEHLVVLTRQDTPLPSFFEDTISRSGNAVVNLPHNRSHIEQAVALRALSRNYDRVILHTHPQDPVPVVAYAKNGGPPVALFNHAHFGFVLCSTVSDLIINAMPYFLKVSERYRFAKDTWFFASCGTGVLPFDDSPIDKAGAKARLSLPQDAMVLMSIGNAVYFEPMRGYDFFRTARRLLDRLPHAYLIVVGVGRTSPVVPPDLRSHPRLLLPGRVENPLDYYRASDICLESFPKPSLGAVAEAVAYGEAFPVPVYGKSETILRVQFDPDKLTYQYRPPDEDSYVNYVVSLATEDQPIRRDASVMRSKIRAYDDGFETSVEKLNRYIDTKQHHPDFIPEAVMIDDEDCQILAEMDHMDTGGKIEAMGFSFLPTFRNHAMSVLQGLQAPHAALRFVCSRAVKRAIRSARR